jgi:predicted RNase H-like HicB family nuclease
VAEVRDGDLYVNNGLSSVVFRKEAAVRVVLYRNQPDGWVAEVPAIRGCYALMPTREEALAELGSVFEMIADEYGQKGLPLPADSTAIMNA